MRLHCLKRSFCVTLVALLGVVIFHSWITSQLNTQIGYQLMHYLFKVSKQLTISSHTNQPIRKYRDNAYLDFKYHTKDVNSMQMNTLTQADIQLKQLQYHNLINVSDDAVASLVAMHRRKADSCLVQGKLTSSLPCTLGTLDTCMVSCDYFCQKGIWHNISDGYPYARFVPQFCNLASPKDADQSLHRYLAKMHWQQTIFNFQKTAHRHHRILVIGDSQGQRYHHALVSVFRQAGFDCQRTKWENQGFRPGKSYYTDNNSLPTEAILIGNRTCRTCWSSLYSCNSSIYRIEVEYLAIMISANHSILPNRTFCSLHHHHHHVCAAHSHQEFIFKVYLHNRIPNLILLFTTFGHDYGKGFQEVADAILYTIDLLKDEAYSQCTRIWFTTSPFLERKMRPLDKTWRFENEYDINGKIIAFNNILYELLHRNFVQSSLLHKPRNIFGYFDLFSMAQSVQNKWAIDHVHMLPQWYRYVIRYLIHILAEQ